MPRANPVESIEVAARHLFRHLNDPAELRRNPIVAHHFASRPERTADAERDAIAAIRRAIREAAGRCERDDLQAGLDRRAQRNARVFEQFYIRGAPYRAAAKALSLSVQQYYLDKQALCLRIARLVSQDGSRSGVSLLDNGDLARARLDIAERRAGVGDFSGARRVAGDIATHGPSVVARIRALCVLASVERERGDYGRSRSWLKDAAALLATSRERMPAEDALIGECQISLWLARVAFDEPSSKDGLEIIEGALRLASAPEPIVDPVSQAVLVDVLMEGAEQHEAIGDFSRAKALAAFAVARVGGLPDAFPQRSHAARMESRLQWVAPSVPGRATVANRLDNFRTALELARCSGNLEGIVRSLLCLMCAHMFVGDDKTSVVYSQRALALVADFGGSRLEAATRLEITDTFLAGTRWRLAGTTLANLDGQFPRGSYSWVYCKVLEAIYLAKIGQSQRSIQVAAEAEDVARASGFSRLSGGLQRVLASSADALGRKSLAQDQIRASIDTVYRNGSLLSLGHTYRVAASITGERRYADLAREIRVALAV
jgi:hypothetical protein